MTEAELGFAVGGLLVGQLLTGIPLSLALSRLERRHRRPAPRDFEVDQVVIDAEVLADWPEDRAAEMLESWRRRRARKGFALPVSFPLPPEQVPPGVLGRARRF